MLRIFGRHLHGNLPENPQPCSTVFGPVLAVLPFEDEADAIALANGHGREKGLLALEEMSTTKTLVHWHG